MARQRWRGEIFDGQREIKAAQDRIRGLTLDFRLLQQGINCEKGSTIVPGKMRLGRKGESLQR